MRRFLAPSLGAPGEVLRLSADVSHHLLRVVGLRRGEPLGLLDGRGGEADGVLLDVDQGQALVEVRAVRLAAGRVPVWLLVSLVRHEAMDLLLRMATELGVTTIAPILAARSVARGERQDRWVRILASAAAQCGRADLPDLRAPAPLASALDAVPEGLERRIYLPGAPLLAPPLGPAALLLGPEGGLTEAETAQALQAGFLPEGLGSLTLRADTAAVAVLARRLQPR